MCKGLCKKIAYLYSAMIVCGACFMSSCGFSANGENELLPYISEKQEEERLSMEISPVLEYELPEMTPGILADRNGYDLNEIKYALCISSELPDKYYVLRADNSESVYIGTPEEITYDEGRDIYTARLFFENIPADGEYYIYAENLGSSYYFEISDDFYRDTYWRIVEDGCEKLRGGEAKAWDAYSLLYSYERYREALYAGNPNAPEVSEAVKEWIARNDFDSYEGTDGYLAAAVLAKFGYNYISVDEKLATECTQKASAMYKELSAADSAADTGEEAEAAFLALVELYRTSATRAYDSELISVSAEIMKREDIYSSRYLLYGAMGYMTTRHSVSRDLCDSLMETLLYKCRDLNDNKAFYESENAGEINVQELLLDAQQFAAMNYILDGYEYNEYILNIVHFLSGRNREAYVYDLKKDYASDAVAVYAWLAWLEDNGKLDPSAPVIWNYSW